MPATRPKSVIEIFGLPDPPKSGRERLVAAAVELFYRHGFNAVGVDQVIAKAGVTKTTFYKHFEGKDDLMVAAVQRRDEWESQAWNRAIKERAGDDAPPAAQFLAMLDVMDLCAPTTSGACSPTPPASSPTPTTRFTRPPPPRSARAATASATSRSPAARMPPAQKLSPTASPPFSKAR